MRTDVTALNRHYAEFYADDARTAWRELGALEKARSVELFVDPPVGRVVDIGCGEGSVIAALEGSLGAAAFAGFEIAPAAVEAARRRHYDSPVEFGLFGDGARQLLLYASALAVCHVAAPQLGPQFLDVVVKRNHRPLLFRC